MPHLKVEHSAGIKLKKDIGLLVRELHYEFAKLETVKLEAVKTRTYEAANSIVGDGTKKDFIFLQVLLLKGRPDNLKEVFVQTMFKIINNYVDESTCCICIEIKELEYYFTTR
jgi:5-carboxymethyl-2-hydroxymuconate isomerase